MINNTRIKYILVTDDKLYQVTHIDFSALVIEARKCDLYVSDVSECELFPMEEFAEFRIRLSNNGEMGRIIDFLEWVNINKP